MGCGACDDARFVRVASIPLKGRAMVSTGALAFDIDVIEELRLRRWARENYVPADERDRSWHPIILEEMRRKDGEVSEHVLVG